MGRLKKSIDSSDLTVRNLLLASALKLFNQKGYASTTVREVVADAGVTKPVLYYYFGNKEGIYLELFEGPLREFEELLEGFSSKGSGASEKLTALCEAISHLYQDNFEKAKLLNAVYYGPPQGTPFIDFEAYHNKMLDAIGRLVEEGVTTGEFLELDQKVVTLAIMGGFHIAMDMLLYQAPAITIGQDTLSHILDIIFHGILKRE
jgi:AcrR family transcriptional regulator